MVVDEQKVWYQSKLDNRVGRICCWPRVSAERLDKKIHFFHKVFETDPKNFFTQIRSIFPFNFAVILRNRTQHSRRMPAKDACCTCSFRFLLSNLSIYQRWNCHTTQNYVQFFFLFLLIIFIAPGGARNCKIVIVLLSVRIVVAWEIALDFMLLPAFSIYSVMLPQLWADLPWCIKKNCVVGFLLDADLSPKCEASEVSPGQRMDCNWWIDNCTVFDMLTACNSYNCRVQEPRAAKRAIPEIAWRSRQWNWAGQEASFSRSNSKVRLAVPKRMEAEYRRSLTDHEDRFNAIVTTVPEAVPR